MCVERKLVAPVRRIREPSGRALIDDDMIAKVYYRSDFRTARAVNGEEERQRSCSRNARALYPQMSESLSKLRNISQGLLCLCVRMSMHDLAIRPMHQTFPDWLPDM
jgi:hypothetical protein